MNKLVKLEPDVYQKLKSISDATGIPMSRLVAWAVEGLTPDDISQRIRDSFDE